MREKGVVIKKFNEFREFKVISLCLVLNSLISRNYLIYYFSMTPLPARTSLLYHAAN